MCWFKLALPKGLFAQHQKLPMFHAYLIAISGVAVFFSLLAGLGCDADPHRLTAPQVLAPSGETMLAEFAWPSCDF
jgi:hypothetical protein